MIKDSLFFPLTIYPWYLHCWEKSEKIKRKREGGHMVSMLSFFHDFIHYWWYTYERTWKIENEENDDEVSLQVFFMFISLRRNRFISCLQDELPSKWKKEYQLAVHLPPLFLFLLRSRARVKRVLHSSIWRLYKIWRLSIHSSSCNLYLHL